MSSLKRGTRSPKVPGLKKRILGFPLPFSRMKQNKQLNTLLLLQKKEWQLPSFSFPFSCSIEVIQKGSIVVLNWWLDAVYLVVQGCVDLEYILLLEGRCKRGFYLDSRVGFCWCRLGVAYTDLVLVFSFLVTPFG